METMCFDSFYLYTKGDGISKDPSDVFRERVNNDQEALRKSCPRHWRLARIGAAGAHALADEGVTSPSADVASPDRAEAVVVGFKASGLGAAADEADQASVADVEQSVRDVAREFDRLLVNNAGVAAGATCFGLPKASLVTATLLNVDGGFGA